MALILVVDDNSDVCKPLAKLLKHLGYQGECAFSGEDALRFVDQQCPDLIILDVMMPGMDGLEVLRRLKSKEETRQVPVVMFSAVADPDYRAHVINKGASDYWIKAAVNFDELHGRIEKLIKPAA